MERDELRIGDAEREQTMADLREHFAQGRLTHEELDERLDRTLAAKTARDLAAVTADLPGDRERAHREPVPRFAAPFGPQFGRDEWRAAMHAHHRQMRSIRHAQREARRAWAGRHPHPWRGRRGPHPVVPFLFLLMIVGLVIGGFGVFKVLLAVWLGAMVFSLVHRRFHYRG